ncbi:TRAP transporter small permease [Paracoccus tibetensis]|uniref:TRAP transporter small permease protein n=1 Tax=Paracoccus tibetensis TaxID=336292 RepID=A0A1G5HRW7_9RHOB|nr:TRAP transporter small permease subunit [Paracoccus tibetensis]SCY66431.1 TRAP-type C4-dicarboxylate transport system, small permease component [Paracoccus tibetensis]
MGFLLGVVRALSGLNETVLKAGRAIGIAALAIMVAVTIVQVFQRYIMNNALAWPDEAARFCMLWMTGLMAPTAFRRGGFVAIDILPMMLPPLLARVLNLILLSLALAVMVVAVQIGWREVTGLGGRFASASLFLPTSLDLSTWYRIPRSWMMASLPVGLILLISVNIELILRNLAEIVGARDLPPIPTGDGMDTGARGVD